MTVHVGNDIDGFVDFGDSGDVVVLYKTSYGDYEITLSQGVVVRETSGGRLAVFPEWNNRVMVQSV